MPKIVDHESRRRDFIEAAYQSLLEEGLAKTTIRGVARRAGYTSGALVHYFSDKDELIRQALEENGKVAPWLDPVRLGRLDQAVEIRAGTRSAQ